MSDLIDTPPLKPRMPLRARLIFVALFFGSAIYFGVQGDYVLAAALSITGMASFSGYRMGAASILGTLVAIGVAIALAPSIGRAHEFRFEEWFGTTGLTNRILTIGTIGILISMAVTTVWFIVTRLILLSRPRVDSMNRWVGFAIGGLEGAVAVMLFLGGMLILEPIERDRAEKRAAIDAEGPAVSDWILGISDGIYRSKLGPTIIANNPFKKIPQLNKVAEVQQSVQVLSDPEKIDELIQHPSIRKLQQRPEMRRAVDRLNGDPSIQEVLRSGRPMDRAAVMTLMNHPAVLELIDQPDFLEEAYKVIQQTSNEQSSGQQSSGQQPVNQQPVIRYSTF